jgi:hypothetical protein
MLAWAAFCAPAKSLPKEWHDVEKLAATLLPRAELQREAHTAGRSYVGDMPFNQLSSTIAAPEKFIPVELQAAGFKRISSACAEHLKGE